MCFATQKLILFYVLYKKCYIFHIHLSLFLIFMVVFTLFIYIVFLQLIIVITLIITLDNRYIIYSTYILDDFFFITL